MGRGDDDAAGPAVGLLASMDRVEAVSVHPDVRFSTPQKLVLSRSGQRFVRDPTSLRNQRRPPWSHAGCARGVLEASGVGAAKREHTLMDAELIALAEAGFVACVALYGGFATRVALRRDWPARKVRLRGGASTQGPFRSIEHVRERDVSAGPPWAVHLAALLGHGLSPVACFSTAAAWMVAFELLSQSRTDFAEFWWIFALNGLVLGFVVGLHQWKGSTVQLSTDYAKARRAALVALGQRLLVDGGPLLVMALWWPSLERGFALGFAILSAPLVHSALSAVAVLASKQHYLAAAAALEERAANRAGSAPTA